MKAKLSGKRIALNIIVAILSVCCFVIGGFCVYADSIMSNINYETVESDTLSETIESGTEQFDFGNISEDNLYHDPKVMNFLLLSLDNYMQGDNGRSDSMMMVSIDTRNEEIKLTSFMRDLYVNIPGYGYSRLNSAYQYGGPSLTMATIEDNFRVNVDRYIIIDFAKFVKIIDIIGGIDIEITEAEAQIINNESKEDPSLAVSGGMMHLTGKQARMYARIRAIDNDFERTNRQRKVVMAAVDKLKKQDVLTLNSYLSDILGMITTDMTKDEVLGLVSNMMSYLNYDISSFRLPADGAYYDLTVELGGVPAMVLVPYLQENIEVLVKYIYGTDNIPELKSGFTLNQYQASYDHFGNPTRYAPGGYVEADTIANNIKASMETSSAPETSATADNTGYDDYTEPTYYDTETYTDNDDEGYTGYVDDSITYDDGTGGGVTNEYYY